MRTTQARKRVRKTSIWGLLLALFIVLGTLLVTYSYREKITRLSAYNQASFQALSLNYEAQLHLRTQIQEWKNILLRGHNAEDLQHYVTQMHAQSDAFREKIEALTSLLRLNKRLEIPIKKSIEGILSSQALLQEAYDKALEQHTLHGALGYQKIDALVRGMDRDIPPQMETLNTQLLSQTKHIREKTLYELRNMNVAIGLSVIIALLIILFTTKSQQDISRTKSMFELIAHHTNDGMVVFEKGKVIYESPGHIRIIGQSILGADKSVIYGLIHPEDRDGVFERFNQAIEERANTLVNSYRIVHPEGHIVYKDDNLSFEYDEAGKLFRTFVMVRDVTQERLKDIKIAESEDRYRTFVELSSDLIFLKDKEFKFLIANQNMARFFGKTTEELIGMNDFELLPYEAAQQCRESDMHALELEQSVVTQEYIKGRIYEVTKYPLVFRGQTCVAGVIRDITEYTKDQEQIYTLAHFHPLTKLPNRRLFLDRLGHAEQMAKQHGRLGALLMMDVDHFKMINDTWGHDKGDILLNTIATRLEAITHAQETLAHLGGDEFILLCEECGETVIEAGKKILEKSEHIQRLLNAPYLIEGVEFRCTVSLGATLLEPHKQVASMAMKEAEIALHHAKESGRNRLSFFESTMQDTLSRQFMLEGALRSGIEKKAFELYYQSQVDHTGKLLGAEALLRWHHEGRLVPPSDFIPLLESTGLIIDVGAWVIEEGCKTLERWSKDPEKAHITLAVNVSPRQFNETGFISTLHTILSGFSFDPRRLKLELTESLFLHNTQAAIDKMLLVRKLGMGLSLDDFGTGYSSLSYLKRIPITQLKIDQSFIRDILDDESDALIVRMIIGVAKHLGVNVIAEGVETYEQLQWLDENGCESYQGYYIDKPQSLSMFEKKWEHHENHH